MNLGKKTLVHGEERGGEGVLRERFMWGVLLRVGLGVVEIIQTGCHPQDVTGLSLNKLVKRPPIEDSSSRYVVHGLMLWLNWPLVRQT